MPAGIMAIRPFGLNDVIPVLDDELAVAAVPRRFPPVLDRLAFRPETGHRLIVILPHQMPLPVARLDEIALAIHGRLRTLTSRTNVSRQERFRGLNRKRLCGCAPNQSRQMVLGDGV